MLIFTGVARSASWSGSDGALHVTHMPIISLTWWGFPSPRVPFLAPRTDRYHGGGCSNKELHAELDGLRSSKEAAESQLREEAKYVISVSPDAFIAC